MLSFMQEQNRDPSPVTRRSPDTGHETLVTGHETPVTGHESRATSDEEYLTVAVQDKNVRKTTCLLAVLFGVGLLCLGFMIKKSAPQTAAAVELSTEEVQIEMAIARLTGVRSEVFSRMDEIVKKFYEFSDVYQVKVSELTKNPFMREIFVSNTGKISDTTEENFDIDTKLMLSQQKDLQLLSIMATDAGKCCMINDKILYEGDSIGAFKVGQIGDSFVRLVWGQGPQDNEGYLGAQILLKLSE